MLVTVFHGTGTVLTSLDPGSWVTMDRKVAGDFAAGAAGRHQCGLPIVYEFQIDEFEVDWDIAALASGVDDMRGMTRREVLLSLASDQASIRVHQVRTGMRVLDATDRYEQSIIQQFGPGVVAWRGDYQTGLSDATVVAIVAGDDGPDLLMANIWTGTTGEMFLRADRFPVAALEAKIPLLQWHTYRLEPDGDNEAARVIAAAGGEMHCLWSVGSTQFHAYLGRVRRPDGSRHLVVVGLDRNNGARTAKMEFDVVVADFVAEVHALTSGSPSP